MTGSRRRWYWTLRARLLAALLALLAAVTVVIGIVSVTTLQHQTLTQVDRQLAASGVRSSTADARHSSDSQGDGSGSGQDAAGSAGNLFVPGQAVGTLTARIVDGKVDIAGVLSGGLDAGNEPVYAALSSGGLATLLDVPADGRPHTVSLPGLGQYRVLETAGNAPDTLLVTGLPLADANSTVDNLTLVVLVVGGAGLLGAGVVGSLIVRFALRPLRRVVATATRVSELPLASGEVTLLDRVPDADTDPRTEVGQVGTALNGLLGHVATALAARQASETRVRQFVADASHELRTPLAAIRGYAELTRRTGDDLPGDIRYAMGRVESEATRMTGLVEDLLLLARLDAGRPVEQEPVDLTALVIDAVSDAHAAGPGHPVSLALPDEAVEVVGDPARLHQVFTNLLTNTRTHTAPGTAVHVALRRDGDVAVIDVEDKGPGIPPELLPHIFERFARADSSRSRNAGSTGLGLAIVSAVVSAHGGSVDVQSRPGRTVFTVRLFCCPPFVPELGRTDSPQTAQRADLAGREITKA